MVGQGGATLTKKVCEEQKAWYLCAPDPALESYALYGLGEAGVGDLFDGRVRSAGNRASNDGYEQNWDRTFDSEADWWQLPGAALIATDGRLRWIHRAAHMGDGARVETILTALQEHLGPAQEPAPAPEGGRGSPGR